jgi:hypothetical protein
MVHEARDARVVDAGEELHLASEALICGMQGQLEGHGA